MECNKSYQDAGCSYCTKYWSCDILSGRSTTQEMLLADAKRAMDAAVKASEVARQIKGGK